MLPSSTNSNQKFVAFLTDKISRIRRGIPQSDMASPSVCAVSVPVAELSSFRPASVDEVAKIIQASPSKSSSLDPIPTWLLKQCSSSLVPVLKHIINILLSSSEMPSMLKEAVISPILKKSSLDPEVLKNYRPVSNLGYASKLIERVVAFALHRALCNQQHHQPLSVSLQEMP